MADAAAAPVHGKHSKKVDRSKRYTFLLECVSEGLHSLKQDEIDSMPLLSATGVILASVCLKTDSDVLYHRLAPDCPVLAFLPPSVNAIARARLLKV